MDLLFCGAIKTGWPRVEQAQADVSGGRGDTRVTVGRLAKGGV